MKNTATTSSQLASDKNRMILIEAFNQYLDEFSLLNYHRSHPCPSKASLDMMLDRCIGLGELLPLSEAKITALTSSLQHLKAFNDGGGETSMDTISDVGELLEAKF
jgi:hypothetical protein